MAIDNGETGFDLCDIDRCNVIRHFPVSNNAINVRLPTQVAFAEGAKLVVGGSDHGVAYVFDRRTGSLVDTLHHALDNDSFVHTVAVCRMRSTETASNDYAHGRHMILARAPIY